MKMKPQTKSGFSLLETIVAIAILMMTIVGPLSLASKGIVFADYVKDEVTAFYLAQEAMEALRNIRDNNIKNGANWLDKINHGNCLNTGNNICKLKLDIWGYISPPNTAVSLLDCDPASDPTCGNLLVAQYNDGSKLYGYGNFPGNPDNHNSSIFSRYITVTKEPGADLPYDLSNGDEVNVTVEVSWVSGAIHRSIQISEDLFD